MLASGMQEGGRREISVQHPVQVVEMFLSVVYTGCILAREDPDEQSGNAHLGRQGFETQAGMQVTDQCICFKQRQARVAPCGPRWRDL